MQGLAEWFGFVLVAALICSGVGILVVILAKRTLREDLKGSNGRRSVFGIHWRTWLKLSALFVGAAFLLYQALLAGD